MVQRRVRGFIFVSYVADHPPLHIHIRDEKGREIGRFDIEHQRPMDDFPLTVKLRRALEEAGYLRGRRSN